MNWTDEDRMLAEAGFIRKDKLEALKAAGVCHTAADGVQECSRSVLTARNVPAVNLDDQVDLSYRLDAQVDRSSAPGDVDGISDERIEAEAARLFAHRLPRNQPQPPTQEDAGSEMPSPFGSP